MVLVNDLANANVKVKGLETCLEESQSKDGEHRVRAEAAEKKLKAVVGERAKLKRALERPIDVVHEEFKQLAAPVDETGTRLDSSGGKRKAMEATVNGPPEKAAKRS